MFCFLIMTGSKPGFRDCSNLLYSKSGSEDCDFGQALTIRPEHC